MPNLAIACGPCNAKKGYRHDNKPASDEKLVHVIRTLQARRRARLRDPLPGIVLPALGSPKLR